MKKNPSVELVIQNGHSGAVNGILLTKDEKKMISYSSDNTIKIWELESGKLLKTLEGHTSGVSGIQLSKDETKIFSFSGDSTIKIWDAKEGRMLKSLEGHTSWINGIQLSKDETKIFSFSGDITIKIWDAKEGRMLKSLEGHTVYIRGIHLSKDESRIFSYSMNGTVKIWDAQNGKLLKSLEEHNREVIGIELSKDENQLFSYSSDNTIKIWDTKEGKLLKSLVGHTDTVYEIHLSKDESRLFSFGRDKTIKIWDIKEGKILRSLTGVSGRLHLSKDESRLFSFGWDKTIKIWDVKEGKLLKSLEGHTSKILGMHLSQDKSKIFYSGDSTVKIRETKEGKLLKSLEGHTSWIKEIQLSKDESRLFSYSSDNSIKIWDVKEGKLLKSLEGRYNVFINGILLNKDETRLFSCSESLERENNTIKIWDVNEGRLLKSFEGPTGNTVGIHLSNDESRLFSYSRDNSIKIWDAREGKHLKSLEGHTSWINGIRLSKDESRIYSYSSDGTIKIWDAKEGRLLKSLEGHTHHIIGIHLSKDESIIYSYSVDQTIKIWDIKEGKLLKSLENAGLVRGIQFNKDETRLISYSADNTIKIWDISNNARAESSVSLLQSLNHYSSKIIKFTFTEDPSHPNLLSSYSSDGSIRYWDISTGALLVTQLLFKEGESIYYTPEGYFDLTDRKVMDYITFVSPMMQNGFLEIQDMAKFRVPGLLEKALSGKMSALKKSSNFTKGIDTVPIIKPLFEKQNKLSSEEEKQSLGFQITENGSRLKYVIAYVDGVQRVRKELDKEEDVKEGENGSKIYMVTFEIPLDFGTNRLEIKAYNEYDIPQSYPVIELEREIPKDAALKKPDLYLLSVGVNKYKENQLSYSVNDALAVAEILDKNAGDLYQKIHKTILTDEKATYKGIRNALSHITKNARPQDVVLIYMSGHGMNAKDDENKSLFYYVPSDFSWPDDPQNENIARTEGIDAQYLDAEFMKINSHKLVLILDACHSGSVNVAMASRGEEKDKATRIAMEEMANGTGRFIFASSSGNQESREHREVGHGLYTFVLLNAFGKNTDRKIENADILKKDGYIYMSELEAYIKTNFRTQTKDFLKGKIQTPPTNSLGRKAIDENINDFPLLRVK